MPQPDQPRISLVIPALNEAENIAPLVGEIAAALEAGPSYEIVFVDDGSDDGTAEAVKALMDNPNTAAAGRVRLLRHGRRAGKSAGLLTAAEAARGTLLVTMDADRQNDPSDVPALVAAFDASGGLGKVGVVAGQRRRRRDTLLKRVSSRTANAVRKSLLKDETRDTGCGLKLIPRDVFLRLPQFEGMHRFLPALAARLGYSIALVTVNDRLRVAGISKYGLWNRLWVGIGDMLATWWLIRRHRLPGEVQEIAAAPKPPGSLPEA
ncbi:MAG: glycosyltransferase family 2 protein [Rhodospirillales bacterium]